MSFSKHLSRRHVVGAMAWAPLAAGATSLLAACSKPVGTLPAAEMLELGARAAIDHIAKGEMKAEAYAGALLAQARAHRNLNAIITLDETRVLEAARAVDLKRAKGEKLGRAEGLLFGVKDQIDAAGYVTTGGNGEFKANLKKTDAPVVEAVTRHGGIVFAKTNMPDMVAGYDWAVAEASQNPYFGTPKNPYNPAHLTGGTSGGNAVAIAARFIPAAIGEDTTGSIRFPASHCGIAGLRPSTYTVENALRDTNRKRYPDGGIVVPPAGPQDTFGPMARSVADVAFLDTLITGEAVQVQDLAKVRIAIPSAAYWDMEFVDPGVGEVCKAAFAKLQAAGAQLVEIDFEAVRNLSEDPRFGEALKRKSNRDLRRWLADNLPGVTLEQVYAKRFDQPHPPKDQPDEPTMPAEERARILTDTARRYAQVFSSNGVIAIAFPTVPVPAPALQVSGQEIMGPTLMIRGKAIDQARVLARNIFWGPRLGGPGLNLPAGLTGGLPVGLELTGLPGDDSKILGLGLEVEKVLGPIAPPPLMRA